MSDLIYTNGNGLRMFLNTAGSSALSMKLVDPYNPLELSDYTMRCRIVVNWNPSTANIPYNATWTQVSQNPNIWDFTLSNANWNGLFGNPWQGNAYYQLRDVLGANTTNVTGMAWMFYNCEWLNKTELFDSSNATTMESMFEGCTSLSAIPLIPTNSVTNVSNMFKNCVAVETGISAMYSQLSANASITSHSECFNNCGVNTVQGAAELALIPDDWK